MATNTPQGKITFGNRVPNSGPLTSPEAIVQVAKESETFGFDSVWVHDHLTWTAEIHRTHISSGSDEALEAHKNPDFFEAMTTLAYLAGILRSARLGMACLVVPCRNPIYAAKQVASLDVLSGGRLDLGVGIGSPATIHSREYEILGVNRRVRGKICDDYIRAMKAVWTMNPSTYEGQFINFTDAEIFPKPAQKPHPPLWVGGWTEAAMKRTALLGDGWLPAWLTAEDIGARYQQVKTTATQAGRDGEAIQLGIEVYVSIDKKSATAKKNAIGTFQASRGTYEREMTLEFLDNVSLIGSPSEINRKIEAYRKSGVSHFETKFIYPSIERLTEMMELFSREVLPNFSA
ncbi:MAG: TIGR03619 family F420-dependent LLM class oxidoreductase [Deltaproteobacteria bacterium]|nr:TIGR03619 family F420-dependent LLM class oxidoreductase [Deltaproteobacteria bacterium]